MLRVSVVIITFNEGSNIVNCIRSAQQISDDIVVVDSGSDDNTVALARQNGAKTFCIEWQGYGFSRNFGAQQSRYPWIFSLDADERITPALVSSIQKLKLTDNNLLIKFRRENFIGNKKIRFGTPGFETIARIYHRDIYKWDNTLVHEKLIAPNATKKIIPGSILHFGRRNYEEYKNRSDLYAQMSAEKYALEGRNAGYAKRLFSPLFNSLKSYIFQLGFLDGKLGFLIAVNIASYSWLKYFYLQQLYSEVKNDEKSFRDQRNIEAASS